MHYRDKYFKSMTKNPSTTNKYLYRKFRNRVVSEQQKGKIKYFQSYFEKNKTNMKMLWTGIKSIVNVKAKNQIHRFPTCWVMVHRLMIQSKWLIFLINFL